MVPREENKILIMSPDTDVYMIGLLLDGTKQKDIILQISTYRAWELRFLNLTTMICLLHNDPDLARIGNKILPKVMQTIYVATGCDYTSFFSQIGKATFLRYYFQYASFIIAGIDSTPGTLADVSLYDGSYKLGYLAFVHLVGIVYFKKHSSGFVTDSPSIHFSKFIDHNLTSKQWHSRWLDDIRQTIWYRTKFENEMIASDEALMLHWKRTCWVLHM